MKLLRAFIEASGYEVEEEKFTIMTDGTRYEGHENAGLKEICIDKEVTNYKVAKKHSSPFPWMDTNSLSWLSIVDYVLLHEEDIELNVDSFGTLKPVLDFFNRNNSRLEESIAQLERGEIITTEFINGELVAIEGHLKGVDE